MGRLIFLGGPGAGKGTQAQILAALCNIPHISTGEIFRAAIQQQTPLGLEAKSYNDRGDLVPDQIVVSLVRERLTQPDAKKGWILDGFPRTLDQANFLEALLIEIQQPYDHAINFEAPDHVLVERMLGRGRKDDTEGVIRHRLQVYRDQTAPLIDFYQQHYKLINVNASLPVEEVTHQLKAILA